MYRRNTGHSVYLGYEEELHREPGFGYPVHSDMIVPRLIERKRDGGRLDESEWHELVAAYSNGDVPDYQMSALLMAVYFRGLDRGETSALTDASWWRRA